MPRSLQLHSILLTVLTSSGAILVLLHGLGIGGPLITGVLLAGSIAVLIVTGDRSRRLILTDVDMLFIGFLACLGGSFLINGWAATDKDGALLAMSLAAYPAGRLMPRGGVGPAFIWISAAVTAVGGIFTAYALIHQWGPLLDRPSVFGYNHAAAVFLISLAFLLIALSSKGWLSAFRTKVLCAAFCVPAFVFGFSLVRFGFVAIVAALAAVASTSGRDHRNRVYMIATVVVLAMTAGLMTRYNTSDISFGLPAMAASAAEETADSADALVRCGVNANSSIATRTVLWREAIALIPDAGWFGIGYTNFGNVTCFAGMNPHNSILQALVEFGWLGGAMFILLILATLLYSRSAALAGDEGRFVFASLIYVFVLGLVHGNVGQDYLLFLFMGYAGRVHQDSFWAV